MSLDIHHEQELEATYEHQQIELFHKKQKTDKLKYCRDVLHREKCQTCPMQCDYMLDIIEEEKKALK